MKKYEGLKSMFNSWTNDGSRENTGDADEMDQVTGSRFKHLKDAFYNPITEAHRHFIAQCFPFLHITISFRIARILSPTMYIPWLKS